jgi:hypothetical protein
MLNVPEYSTGASGSATTASLARAAFMLPANNPNIRSEARLVVLKSVLHFISKFLSFSYCFFMSSECRNPIRRNRIGDGS